ncbi:MAG: pyruvate, phosphate dikinase, partial [candidate division Zixibacteria bacterium]|nr:pyruvate, phosphate dikinase [candidate division Zixibacteria bacterium]
MRDLLGGKGAGLAEMTRAGVPVPPGFTITTEVCKLFYQNNLEIPTEIDHDLEKYIAKVEAVVGAKFGDAENPLLVSVRSGAKFSMPGMMDTILNLGLNKTTIEGLIKKTGDPRFAYDNYRRFVQMFGNVVLGIDKEKFEEIIEAKKKERRIKQDSSLQVEDLNDIIKKYKVIIKRKTGETFPDNPNLQLQMARDAVFRSWNNPRAISYRKLNNIPGDLGTAVNIQAMVYGNMGNSSATGVGFTRNPATGEKEFYGEYLLNAQGEDVVAGIRTPQPISLLADEMPEVYRQLKEITTRLEKHYRDVQDFEFTVQEGKLYMLQTRTGKRTVQAALKIAVDMVKEKLITVEEALMRIEPTQLDQLLHPRLDPKAEYEVIAKGLPASPGAASGAIYFNAETAVKAAKNGESVILVRQETNPDDIEGMNAADGILTARGGMTSHAAVVARGMGKCCVAGCEAARVNEAKKQLQVGKLIMKEKEIITINGSTGEVIIGPVATIEPELSGEFAEFMAWADEIKKLKVRTNADIPRDAIQARKYGAEGIGLCRTEHMFFAEDRLPIVQEMILAESKEKRQEAIVKLLPMQKEDFRGIFRAMDGLPVTIRLLDPPLHEFLPSAEELTAQLRGIKEAESALSTVACLTQAVKYLDPSVRESLKPLENIAAIIAEIREKKLDKILIQKQEETLRKVKEMMEVNPMLGHRGVRLGISYPEIYIMQIQAILEAAAEAIKEGVDVKPEIMVPQVCTAQELRWVYQMVEEVKIDVEKKYGIQVPFLFGTMVEVVRACMRA